MIDVQSNFDKNSNEYKELEYRIICGQNYQQNAIDRIKGIISKPMPKEWYDFHSAKNSKNKDFNLRILADKKPYFFIYNYPYLMKRYKKYISNSNTNCLIRFGLDINELIKKENKTQEENTFLHYYNLKMPVFKNKSVMNRICWRLEEEFDNYKLNSSEIVFDYSILKSDIEYSKSNFNKIKLLYDDYKDKIKQHTLNSAKEKIEKDEEQVKRYIFKEEFKSKTFQICNNKYELCNIVLDLCYKNNNSKQFAWDICGDIIIENLLKKNNYIVEYPIEDKNGDIEYCGERFSLYSKEIESEEIYDINIE